MMAFNRAETNGRATTDTHFRISGAIGGRSGRLRTIYVGKLKADTSAKKIRAHLSDISVSHVSDVLKLPCKTTGQASFCISVDTAVDEDIVFDSQKWPKGVRIRPYNERGKTQEKLKNKVYQKIDAT